jgi:hypothetical protein
MPKHIARYAITNGLAGCFMPDHHSGAYEFATRRELAAEIRSQIETQGWPASMFAEVKIRRLWGFIARNGSSVAHFSITRDGYEIAFHGLTEDEYKQQSEADAD